MEQEYKTHDMKNNKMTLVKFVRIFTVVLNLPSIRLGKRLDMKRWMLPSSEVQTEAEGPPVSALICAQKATSFHMALGLEHEFNVSTEWLARLNQ
jgi:hypothetical protein